MAITTISKEDIEKIKKAVERYEFIITYCDDGFASDEDFETVDDAKEVLFWLTLGEE